MRADRSPDKARSDSKSNQKISDFDKLAARHLNQNDVRSILEAAHHLSINGIQKPSSATRSVSGKHKSNSTLDSPKRISRSGKE